MTQPSSLPLMPGDTGEVSPEQARLVGYQLAEHPLLAARADDARPEVAEVLADARPLLSTYGITFEVVRSRPGFVVVRARTDGPYSGQVACEMVKGLLAGVTEEVCDVKASVVENTCVQRGAAACLSSTVWEDRPASPVAPLPTEAPPEETTESGEVEGSLGPQVPDWQHLFESSEPPAPMEGAPRPTDAPAVPSAPRSAEVATSPTAASSTAYQFQVTAPHAIVVPPSAPPRNGSTLPAPPPVAPVVVSSPPAVASSPPAPRRHYPRALVRRAWILVLALVAGSAGGWYAGMHAGTSYGAQATLVVQSGASKGGPGNANDALALATTYSALIPKDQAILGQVGGIVNMSPSQVQHALSVTVENGTSLLLVNFSSSNAAQAVQGADAVARAVASSTPLSPAIAPGSVAIVGIPKSAHHQGTLHRYGAIIGGFLGLIVGLILVLAAERTDPRVDDARDMATAAGCRAAQVPNELSVAELARVLADAGREKGGLTVVPVAVKDTDPTRELARVLQPCWPADGPAVSFSPAFATGIVELSRGSGPTVLVSHPGARQREVAAAVERLKMIGRAPVWAVMTGRVLRRRRWVSGRVG